MDEITTVVLARWPAPERVRSPAPATPAAQRGSQCLDGLRACSCCCARNGALGAPLGPQWSERYGTRIQSQIVRGHQPQSWKDHGPERAAGLSFWLYSAVWVWYLDVCGKRPRFAVTPWFTKKSTPSFADALAELRRTLWHERISPASDGAPLNAETVKILVEALAVAA